jgi:hypothetical protein
LGINTVATVDGESRFNAIFSKYLDSSDSDIGKFVESIPSKFDDAIDALRDYPWSELTEEVKSNRQLLKKAVTKFHNKAATLNSNVTDQIELLDNERSKIYVGIHQPNLFAFSGVFKKIVLLQALADHSKNNDFKIIPLFLVVDHDFMDDKWMHVAKLPSIKSASGVLDLRYPINDSKRWKISSNMEPPTHSLIKSWENIVYNWIRNSNNLSKPQVKTLYTRFEEFWRLVEQSAEMAENYAEFNSIVMSKITNQIWKYRTLFVNLSDLSSVFEHGYNYLISNNETYLESLDKSETFFRERGIFTGVSANLNKHSPLWLHCSCGSKASSKIRVDNNEYTLIGRCISCKKYLTLPIGETSNVSIPKDKIHMVSPRAIPILLLLSRELSITGYISGTGGSIGYTIVGKKVFDDLKVRLPVMVLWAGTDVYSGIGQREAADYLSENSITNVSNFLSTKNKEFEDLKERIKPLVSRRNWIYKDQESLKKLLDELFKYKQEQRAIKDTLKNVQKSKNALKLKSCIIDYAVNFGLEHVEKEWSCNLVNNNDLTKPVMIN